MSSSPVLTTLPALHPQEILRLLEQQKTTVRLIANHLTGLRSRQKRVIVFDGFGPEAML